jgi:GNAT superfamily N-acetyltransferase
MIAMAEDICPKSEVFARHGDVNKLYDMRILASHPDYRGKGIGNQLIRQSLQVNWGATVAQGKSADKIN